MSTSRNLAEDYFSMTRPTRDGGLSPYQSSTMTPYSNGSNSGNSIPNGLQPTLSWGETPEFAGLTKTKSHSGQVVYKSTGFGRSLADLKVYPYHTIHLTVPVPESLRPISSEDVLTMITGKCVECSSISNQKCDHVALDSCSSLSSVLKLPTMTSSRNGPLLKSILSKKDNKTAQSDSQFANSVSFDTVNLKFSDDLNNYPMTTFSDSEDDDNNNGNNNSNSDNDDSSRGRLKSNDILQSRKSSRSPSRSLSPRTRGPMQMQLQHMSSNNSIDMVTESQDSIRNIFNLQYPTSPIVTHDACTITKKHKLFDDMYAGRLKQVEPKLKNRNIMCHISGRRHTWVGIDWACNQFLEDGDTLIIVAAIKNPGRSLNRFQRRDSDLAIVSNITENKIRNSPEYAQTVTENIMKYTLALLNPDRVVKITVELAIGSTSDVFNDMFDLYQPSLIIIGAKPGRAPPTKSWATKRITDRIVSSSPVPTIIVSPVNMGLYETKLFKILDKRMQYLNKDNRNTYLEKDELYQELDNIGVYTLKDQRDYIRETANNDKFILKELNSAIKEMNQKEGVENESDDDSESDSDADGDGYQRSYNSDDDSDTDAEKEEENKSITSVQSADKVTRSGRNISSRHDDEVSVDSANPPAFHVSTKATPSFKLKRLELETQVVIYKEVAKLESEPLTEDSFKHLLTVISDAAHKYGVQLAESAKRGGEESALVRTLTGAPEHLQRAKSMVSDKIEEDDFEEKLKRYRQQKRVEQQEKLNAKKTGWKSVPKINIETPNNSAPMASSGILSKADSFLSAVKSPASIASSDSVSTTGATAGSSRVSQSDSKDKAKTKKKKRGFFGLFK